MLRYVKEYKRPQRVTNYVRMRQEFGELKRSGNYLNLFQYIIPADSWSDYVQSKYRKLQTFIIPGHSSDVVPD